MFVADARADYIVEAFESMGLVMALCVASIVFFCYPYVVDVTALSICSDLQIHSVLGDYTTVRSPIIICEFVVEVCFLLDGLPVLWYESSIYQCFV